MTTQRSIHVRVAVCLLVSLLQLRVLPASAGAQPPGSPAAPAKAAGGAPELPAPVVGCNLPVSTGGITGTVTSSAGLPLVAVSVYIYQAGTRRLAGFGFTDASGRYARTGLPNGAYQVLFVPDGDYGFEWYAH